MDVSPEMRSLVFELPVIPPRILPRLSCALAPVLPPMSIIAMTAILIMFFFMSYKCYIVCN